MAAQTIRGAVAAKGDPNGGGEPGSAVAKTDSLKRMLNSMQAEIERQLPKHIPIEYFMRTVLTGLRSKSGEALLKCERSSLFAAMLEAARYGLMPFTEEAAIVPFGKTATFIPQYQGLVQMFYRTGQVAAVEAHLIHKHDDWGIAYGDGGGFWHKPLLSFDDEGNAVSRGPAVLAYCYVQLKSGARSTVVTVTRQEACQVRDERSRSYQRANTSQYGKPPTLDSTWHTEFDAMWLKTAVRQVSKWVPKSPELVELLLADTRDDARHAAEADAQPLSAWGLDIGSGPVLEGEVIHDSDDGNAQDQRPAPPGPSEARKAAAREFGELITRAGVAQAPAAMVLAFAAELAKQTARSKAPALASFEDLTDAQLDRVNSRLAELLGRGGDAGHELRELARAGGWAPQSEEASGADRP